MNQEVTETDRLNAFRLEFYSWLAYTPKQTGYRQICRITAAFKESIGSSTTMKYEWLRATLLQVDLGHDCGLLGLEDWKQQIDNALSEFPQEFNNYLLTGLLMRNGFRRTSTNENIRAMGNGYIRYMSQMLGMDSAWAEYILYFP
jgi:hypothetical protein